MPRLARATALVFALLACAWFALSARQALDTSRAGALIGAGKPLSPSQAAHVRRLLDGAGQLNPDRSVELLRGQLASNQRRYRAAEALFASVTRREPMNLEAWSQLVYAAAAAGDRATVVLAARHISELYPKLK